ncbi:uncharacterized protein BO80DRAFT_95445 [Aspergillus ibericus CBS 121593]|uniref:Uncharacterized protein n=1 Tax=Aspergillus ibericus CBS 121593 TaxID=1448316 RepID=A0A395GZ97_9EURO|nr:hypothetical protein BO80DRAFT_95445 [Aspergillus ibericus CBS 121593]RAL00690.1 hypothetical protein BO80DRAFT_95445 [Aspergillus ibericus CBS 121593]
MGPFLLRASMTHEHMRYFEGYRAVSGLAQRMVNERLSVPGMDEGSSAYHRLFRLTPRVSLAISVEIITD